MQSEKVPPTRICAIRHYQQQTRHAVRAVAILKNLAEEN
jgi:hypothetical protein